MIKLTNLLNEATAKKDDNEVVNGIYDPDYSDYGLVLFKSPKKKKDFAKYGLKGAELLSASDFKKKYIEFSNKKLKKVLYKKKINLGSNLGEGEYWCTTDYCIDIYTGQDPDTRRYAPYVDKIIESDIPSNYKILVKEGFVDDIRFS